MMLSDDVLCLIASYFSGDSLKKSAFVCRQWKAAIFDSDRLWKALACRYGLDKLVDRTSSRSRRSCATWVLVIRKYSCSECASIDNGTIIVDINGGGGASMRVDTVSLFPFCNPCFKSVSSISLWKDRLRDCLPNCKARLPAHVFASLIDKFPYRKATKAKKKAKLALTIT